MNDATRSQENVAFHDLPANLFPIMFTFFDADWKVRHRERVDGPAAVPVQAWEGPTGIQINYGDGSIAVTAPPPLPVYEAARGEDPGAIDRWLKSRCDRDDAANRIGCCPLDEGHKGACEIKFFIPGSPDYVGRVVFNDRPIEDVPGI